MWELELREASELLAVGLAIILTLVNTLDRILRNRQPDGPPLGQLLGEIRRVDAHVKDAQQAIDGIHEQLHEVHVVVERIDAREGG